VVEYLSVITKGKADLPFTMDHQVPVHPLLMKELVKPGNELLSPRFCREAGTSVGKERRH
jgi:hypothetical protein